MYEAFLVALWAALCGIDKYDVALNFHRPLITGPVIGFILGDVQTGLIAGAAMELAWLGLVPNAGSQPQMLLSELLSEQLLLLNWVSHLKRRLVWRFRLLWQCKRL